MAGSDETCFGRPDIYPPTPPPKAAEKTTKAATPTTIQKTLRWRPHIVGRAGDKAVCWSPTTSGACRSGLMAILSSLDECRAGQWEDSVFGQTACSQFFTFQPTPLLSASGQVIGHHLISSRNGEYGCGAATFNCPLRPVLIRQKLGTISRRVSSADQLIKRLISPPTIMANMGPLQTKSLFRCPSSSPRDSSHGLDVGER